MGLNFTHVVFHSRWQPHFLQTFLVSFRDASKLNQLMKFSSSHPPASNPSLASDALRVKSEFLTMWPYFAPLVSSSHAKSPRQMKPTARLSLGTPLQPG